jgi:outer membrane receptor protein involved in Fe transport
MSHHLKAIRRMAVAACAVFALDSAFAGTAWAVEPDTVLVTARKREESLQDVPVTIQAFTDKDLEQYRSIDLSKIGEMSSQLIIFPTASGSGAALTIRGMGASAAGDSGFDASVTLDVDGMQITRGHIIRAGMFDLASVQVLKGPQALFFGKNSPAGVIALKSNDPTPEWEFTGRLSYEIEADEFVGEAIASGPINEKLGIRLGYRGRTERGWLKNAAGPVSSPVPYIPGYPFDQEPNPFPGTSDPRRGSQEEHIGRLTLALDPSDRFDATLKVLGALYSDDGAALNEVTSCSGPMPITTPVASLITLVDPYGDCTLDGRLSSGELPPEIAAGYDGDVDRKGGRFFTSVSTILTTLNMNYRADKFTITSQTGLYYYKYTRYDNFDGTTYNQFLGIQFENNTNFSQELRFLSSFDFPLNVMFGLYYEHGSRDSDNNGKIAAHGPDPISGRTNSWNAVSTVTGDTYSAFGQLIWKVTPEIELAGGARFTREEKDATQQNTYRHPVMTFLKAAGEVIDSTFEDSDVSPEATLTWTPTEELTLYGAYKTGYKSGGFSTNTVITANATSASVSYDPETSEGFEIGLKSMLFAGALRLNVTGYRYTFRDMQVSAFDSSTTSFQIRNAASARTTGVEAEANWLVGDGLMVRGQVGYNRARYVSFPEAPCYSGQTPALGCIGRVRDLSGQRMTLAPDWNGSVGFTYDTPVFNGWSLGLASDVTFSSSYLSLNSPFARQESFAKVNASIRLYSDDDRWAFAVIGRNLGNKRILGGSADKPGGVGGDIYSYSPRAREITFEITTRF